jgi:hypothetical protein
MELLISQARLELDINNRQLIERAQAKAPGIDPQFFQKPGPNEG